MKLIYIVLVVLVFGRTYTTKNYYDKLDGWRAGEDYDEIDEFEDHMKYEEGDENSSFMNALGSFTNYFAAETGEMFNSFVSEMANRIDQCEFRCPNRSIRFP